MTESEIDDFFRSANDLRAKQHDGYLEGLGDEPMTFYECCRLVLQKESNDLLFELTEKIELVSDKLETIANQQDQFFSSNKTGR